MNFSITNIWRSIPKWVTRTLLILTALLILIFNDAFGDNEQFVLFSFLYFILLCFLSCRWLFRQIKSIIKLKHEKKKTELLHLKSQVNPHFFFNTLNNLYGIMDKNSQARMMVLKLSDMMRYSIYEGQKEWVTLEEEIVYLENYIDLQEIRYHKKTDVQFHHKVINQESRIMPLLFIILLENAYKHGLETLEKDAYIYVQLTADEKEIIFNIENNFDLSEATQEQGIGLKNLKRRLELVYPNKHMLAIATTKNKYTVKLSLAVI